jgi:XTP/dITP diphosphohydrolase
MPRLLIASNNPGKVVEFKALLVGSGWEIVAPADISLDLDVHETGRTYAENARIKARAFASASGVPALSDDSGLEVEALDGQPGPLHHILGWDGADSDERIAILLQRLRGVSDRAARYRAVVVVAFPDGSEIEGEGSCAGVIIDEPRGEGGFGYDPVFFLPQQGRTMAQLSFEEKNEISHRARAVASLAPRLSDLAAEAPQSSAR